MLLLDGQYESEDEAIVAAENMAKNNKPSLVKILNENHDVVEERKFLIKSSRAE